MSWQQYWEKEVRAVVEPVLQALQTSKVEHSPTAMGTCFTAKNVLESLKATNESRNVVGFITWTPAVDDEEDLLLVQVQRLMDVVWTGPPADWVWPRQMSIPIKVSHTESLPTKGQFRRYGMGGLVAAYWLRVCVAVQAGDSVSVDRLKEIGRNVCFDFALLKDDVSAILAAAQLRETNEFLREHFGLSGLRLVSLVQGVKKILQEKRPPVSPTPAAIADYLSQKIRWSDAKRVPSTATCQQLMTVGNILAKCSAEAKDILTFAEAKWGRGTLFEEYSKLLLIVQKTTNTKQLVFVFGGYMHRMASTGNSESFAKSDLTSNCGSLAMWRFLHSYSLYLVRKYGLRKDAPPGDSVPQDDLARLADLLESPWLWSQEVVLGRGQNLFWTNRLPDWAKKLYDHWRLILSESGMWASVLKGFLSSPGAGGSIVEGFISISVVGESLNDIDIDLARSQPLVTMDTAMPESSDAQIVTAGEGGRQPQSPIDPRVIKEQNSQALQEKAIARATERLNDKVRFKTLTNESVLELQGGKELPGRMLMLYDVKTVALVKPLKGKSPFQVRPAFDKHDFRAWATKVDSAMRVGEDFCAVFVGKARVDFELEKIINEQKWNHAQIMLLYDVKQLAEYGRHQRQKGVANSNTVESLLLCWKGKTPPGLPKQHMYVDMGSPIWMDFLRDVPLAHPERDLVHVEAEVKEAAYGYLGGSDSAPDLVVDDEEADSGHEGGDCVPVKYAKRRSGRALFRNPTTSKTTPFFHLDPHPSLIREVISMTAAKWVLICTPGGGAPVLAALEAGVPCVAVFRLAKHLEVLQGALRLKLADMICDSGTAFVEHALCAEFQDLASSSDASGLDSAEEVTEEYDRDVAFAEEREEKGSEKTERKRDLEKTKKEKKHGKKEKGGKEGCGQIDAKDKKQKKDNKPNDDKRRRVS